MLITAVVGADSWPGAVALTRFSDDGGFFVRITPGTSIGDTRGSAGALKGPYASARFYALQRDATRKQALAKRPGFEGRLRRPFEVMTQF